jgi:hypothetical protein
MFYPILLSMIAAVAGVPARDPEPTVRVSLNSDGQYVRGDRAKVQVITRDDGYLVVFQVTPGGRLRVLYPLDPTDDNYVKGGKRYLLLGRGGREGFTVDDGGTGVVFGAVSIDPWRFAGYVQNDHWDLRALNPGSYDDTESDLVNLAQAMAGGRFDYDILGYTVASDVAMAEDPVVVSGSIGVVDTCFNCASPVGVIYGTGYYNTWGVYDPWYYSPYYNYGPYYPAWAYGPTGGWGWGWGGCYGYGCNGGGWGYYYPPYPTAVAYVPYSPYQKKSWDRTWSGAPVPYRPRGASGYTATNSVAGQLPGIGVQQHASFRDRTWSTGGAVAGGPVAASGAVPVSRAGYSPNGGRRRDAAPATSGSSVSSSNTTGKSPTAVPTRPRAQSTAPAPVASTPTAKRTTNRMFDRPEARPARPTSEIPTAVAAPSRTGGLTASTTERRVQNPVEWTRGPATPAPVSRPASEAPAATKASTEGKSSEPVLRRREPEQQPTATAAPSPRQASPRQQDAPPVSRTAPERGSSPPQRPTSNMPGSSGGGHGGGGRATAAPPSSAPSSGPSAVAGGRRR